MKYLKLLILLIFISGCSNKKEFNGYWYGEFERKYIAKPVLLKFEGYTYIEFNSINQDTIKYNYFRNNLYSEENEFGGKRDFKYKIENDQLSLFDITNDSLIITLKRPKENNIALEYLKDTSLKIDLPRAKGFQKTFGYEFRLNNPFYLAYQNNKLVANFLDTTIEVDSLYFKFLQEKRKELTENFIDDKWRKVLFVADKNIKISDFRKVVSQLQMGNINRADFCLNTENMNYEDLNMFSLRFSQMDEKEYAVFEKYNMGNVGVLPPPKFFTEEILAKNVNKIMLVEVFDKQIKLNNEIISKSEFKERLINTIEEKNEVFIFYYLDKGMTYQDYVDFNLLFMRSIYSVRADYLNQKHDINYTGKESHRELDERGQEAFRKYPMILHLLDSTELKMTKKIKL